MKKMIGIAVAVVVVLAVLRRFGPALRDRAMGACQAKCQEMFAGAGHEFPGEEMRQHFEGSPGQKSGEHGSPLRSRAALATGSG